MPADSFPSESPERDPFSPSGSKLVPISSTNGEDEDAKVLAAIERQTRPVGRLAQVSLFVGTLFLFVAIGWLLIRESTKPWPLFSLLAVLLVHELGHFLSMYAFGYRNLRMFFIPLLGAAVSGQNLGATIPERAVILLMGPLPGLIIGYIVAFGYVLTGSEIYRTIAFQFILINAFNLLPLYPLDGGQFWRWILVDRPPLVQITPQVALMILTFVPIFFGMEISAFGNPGFLIGIGIMPLIQLNFIRRVARKVQAQHDFSTAGMDVRTPPVEAVRAIIPVVRTEMKLTRPKQVAGYVLEVWQQVTAQRPELMESVVLVGAYVLTWGSVIIVRLLCGL